MNEELKLNIFEERIIVYLMTLKITPNLKGYTYIKECAMRIYQDPSKKFDVKKNLFCEIAQKLDEKPALIERGLRHAIEVSSRRDGIKDFEKMMKYEFYKEKPTPRELLCVMVERASMECNKYLSNLNFIVDKWQENLLN